MTRDQFKQANLLQRQMDNVTRTIIHIGEHSGELKCEPMTRQTTVYMRFGLDERCPTINLSEGELVCVREALKEYKERLNEEFEKL